MIERKRQIIIQGLVAKGHSPTKALEIALDLERGDIHAARWADAIGLPGERHPATTIGE